MKIFLLSNTITGGAGRAAYRLHQGLLSLGLDSEMRVRFRANSDPTVTATSKGLSKVSGKLNLAEHLDTIPFRLCRQKPKSVFSLQWFSDTVLSDLTLNSADVLNLHWIGHNYLSVNTIGRIKQPIVWTLHDMWAFTGGCHYSQSCHYYKKSCGSCPQLQSSKVTDLSRWSWQRKAKAWKNLNLTFVVPSVWLGQCVQSSSLFSNNRVEVIPNGLNTQIYCPLDRSVARARLGLPKEKKLVLFGAMSPTGDPRKGFHLLQQTLRELSGTNWHDRIELVVFGAHRPVNEPELGFPTHYLGSFSDDVALSLLYSASDVFVAPSIEDNLPNTVMESLACGTPCVAFRIGGMPDMIDHQSNGYLACPFKVEDLAQGIAWVLENDNRHKILSQNSREKVENAFALAVQAKRYARLFEDVANI